MSGCDRCGHPERQHVIRSKPDPLGMNDPTNRLCAHLVAGRLCLCPRYIKTPR